MPSSRLVLIPFINVTRQLEVAKLLLPNLTVHFAVWTAVARKTSPSFVSSPSLLIPTVHSVLEVLCSLGDAERRLAVTALFLPAEREASCEVARNLTCAAVSTYLHSKQSNKNPSGQPASSLVK